MIALLLLACSTQTADVDLPTELEPTASPVATPAPPTPEPRVPQPRRWDCAGLDPADEAPLGGKVTLTFDDGPHPTVTPQILDLLEAENIPATFFLIGDALEDPDVWPIVERMVANPLFTIGNHSWTHSNLATMTTAARDAEIDDTNELLLTFADVAFFRFPYGSSDCDLADGVRARGLHMAGWHVDTVDWCYGADGVCTPADYNRIPPEYATDMLGYTMEQIERFDGGIVLLHDIHQNTADELPELIQRIRDQGMSFTALDDADTWPNLLADTPVDLPFLGESCNPIDDKCWQIEFGSWCAPLGEGFAGICVLPCEGTCADRPGAATTLCATVGLEVGECVGRAHAINDWCERLPHTVSQVAERYVGASSASPLRTAVCR